MERKLKDTEITEKHQKVTEFYFQKDNVCIAPGMKDFITIHKNEKKTQKKKKKKKQQQQQQQFFKHNLIMNLHEAYSLFVITNPDISISFSVFAKLRPKIFFC